MGTLTARVFVKTEIRRMSLDAGARNIDKVQTENDRHRYRPRS